MVKLANIFGRIRPFRALVLGDFMLDVYTTGRVKRISPEAPVPVMEVLRQESFPGGAGNAAANLAALGAEVFVIGRLGADAHGSKLKELLGERGIHIESLLVEPGLATPVKNRLIADSQQLLRVDMEMVRPVSEGIEQASISRLKRVIPEMHVVAISDYGKGFLSNRCIAEAIQTARQAHIPVIVDPKGMDFSKYRGATLVKPNLSEAYAAANLPPSSSLDEAARRIIDIAGIDLLLITRSEEGISLFDRKGVRNDFPVFPREVKDVTGAGDTVLAMMSLGLANGLDLSVSVQLANVAAGIAIERLGCARISLAEVAERLLETDCQNKIFDESHTFALQQVLREKHYVLLVLEKGQSMTGGLYRTIRQLAQKGRRELVFYLRDPHPDEDFIHLLSSHHDVRAIILQKESLKHLCGEIRPHEVLFLDGESIMEGKEFLASLCT